IASPRPVLFALVVKMPVPMETPPPPIPVPMPAPIPPPPPSDPVRCSSTPFAPSDAASFLSRSMTASIFFWSPNAKEDRLEASMTAISSYFGGAAEYSVTCAGSIGARGFPVMTCDVVAQPASAKTASPMTNDQGFENGFMLKETPIKFRDARCGTCAELPWLSGPRRAAGVDHESWAGSWRPHRPCYSSERGGERRNRLRFRSLATLVANGRLL